MFESEALLNVLGRKGVIRKAEVLEELKRDWEKAAKAHWLTPKQSCCLRAVVRHIQFGSTDRICERPGSSREGGEQTPHEERQDPWASQDWSHGLPGVLTP